MSVEWLLGLVQKTAPAKFLQLLGGKSVTAISGFSWRYAVQVHPHGTKDQQGTLALWLAIVWCIDNVFDEHMAFTSEADIERLRQLVLPISSEDVADEVVGATTAPMRHPLVAALLETVAVLYPIYRSRVAAYASPKSEGGRLIRKWFGRYLKSLRRPCNSCHVEEYGRDRLVAGAMMCVIGHIMMADNPQATHALGPRSRYAAAEHTATATAFLNDLVSLPRDIAHGTPNLVTVRMREKGDNAFVALHWASGLVDQLESRLAAVVLDSPEWWFLRTIVSGARYWHFHEPRYADGVAIYDAYRKGDEALFWHLMTPQPTKGQLTPRYPRVPMGKEEHSS